MLKPRTRSEFKARISFRLRFHSRIHAHLLNSATPRISNGLATPAVNSATIHGSPHGCRCQRKIPHEVKCLSAIAPRHLHPALSKCKDKHKDFVRGYGYQAARKPRRLSAQGHERAWRGIQECASNAWPLHLSLGGFANASQPQQLRGSGQRKARRLGIPTLKIHCDWSENERAMSRHGIQAANPCWPVAQRTSRSSGKSLLRSRDSRNGTAHGTRSKNFRPHANNQTHDAKNLFMTDGACMVSARAESFAHLHGADGARLRFRRFRDEEK